MWMMALSSNDLTQIRADVESLLPDTGDILSSSLVSDGAGGWTTTWGTATSGVSYRLDPIRQREIVAGAALTSYNQFQLTLPYDTTVTAENRFQASDGTQYSILGVDDSKSWRVSVRCVVEKL
jgi:SPP1 family predicted phage head-tail adaptor